MVLLARPGSRLQANKRLSPPLKSWVANDSTFKVYLGSLETGITR
jgi:hypothetical protein